MKLIVAGSRSIKDYKRIGTAIDESGWREQITEVVSGGAWGVDRLGELWARQHGIPVKRFPARWKDYPGKSAGMIRNRQMAEYADALLAIWDGTSAGTRGMIDIMTGLSKPTCIVRMGREPMWLFQG